MSLHPAAHAPGAGQYGLQFMLKGKDGSVLFLYPLLHLSQDLSLSVQDPVQQRQQQQRDQTQKGEINVPQVLHSGPRS